MCLQPGNEKQKTSKIERLLGTYAESIYQSIYLYLPTYLYSTVGRRFLTIYFMATPYIAYPPLLFRVLSNSYFPRAFFLLQQGIKFTGGFTRMTVFASNI